MYGDFNDEFDFHVNRAVGTLRKKYESHGLAYADRFLRGNAQGSPKKTLTRAYCVLLSDYDSLLCGGLSPATAFRVLLMNKNGGKHRAK